MKKSNVFILLSQIFFMLVLYNLVVDVKEKYNLNPNTQRIVDDNKHFISSPHEVSVKEDFIDNLQDFPDLDIFEGDKSEFLKLESEYKFDHKNSIFFVEEFFNSDFRLKFLCSIESASFVHPNISIDVMVMSPKLQLTKTIKILLRKHKNIRFMFLNATEFYSDSPLKEWFSNGTWKRTKYPQMNLGDVTRILLLWKYGGIYLDLDVISMRYLNHKENFFGIEYPYVNSAVMGFRKRHQFLEECFRFISSETDLQTWGIYGPTLITKVLKERCGMSLPSTTLYNCSDIKLYKEKVFSSIRGRFAVKYIRPNKKLADKILNDEEILGFHFYNHMSEKLGVIPLTKENPIGMIARKFCPVVALQSNFMFTK